VAKCESMMSRKGGRCGRPMYLIGHTTKRHLVVEVCPFCDAAENIPTVRELRKQ